MLAVTWRPAARIALNDIVDYISQHDAGAARRIRERILDAVDMARTYPEMFRAGRVPGTREIVAHPNYIVVYRVLPDRIRVTQVIHSRQQYP